MSKSHFPKVCKHFDLKKKGEDRYNTVAKCRLAHLGDRTDSCNLCDGLVHCSECPTELILQTKTIEDKGKAIVITRWRARGPISTSDAYDWQDQRFLQEGAIQVPGRLRLLFEDQPGTKYDDIVEACEAWDLMMALGWCNVPSLGWVPSTIRFRAFE